MKTLILNKYSKIDFKTRKFKYLSIDETYKLIGNNLRNLRKLYGFTLKELSEISGINANYLGNIERAQRKPTLYTLNQLAYIFNINVNTFFSYTKEKIPEKEILMNKILAILKTKETKDIRKIFALIKKLYP